VRLVNDLGFPPADLVGVDVDVDVDVDVEARGVDE